MVRVLPSSFAPAELTTKSDGTGPVGVTTPMVFCKGTCGLTFASCAKAPADQNSAPPTTARQKRFLASIAVLPSWVGNGRISTHPGAFTGSGRAGSFPGSFSVGHALREDAFPILLHADD